MTLKEVDLVKGEIWRSWDNHVGDMFRDFEKSMVRHGLTLDEMCKVIEDYCGLDLAYDFKEWMQDE